MTATQSTVIDLRSELGPVGDQGRRGTCVAFCLTALHRYAIGIDLVAPLSEEFVHWAAKKRGGSISGGTTFVAATDTLASEGQALASLFPYDPKRSHQGPQYAPSAAAIADAATRTATGTSVTTSVAKIRALLLDGKPVAMGIPLWPAFHSTDGKDVVPVPINAASLDLQHAVVIAGHDPTRSAILIRNSWGPKWGDRGYAWFDDTLPDKIRISSRWSLEV